MNDDTSRTEGWSSPHAGETTPRQTEGATPVEARPSEDRVGFCQDCGKPLTQTTVRSVGTGTFCEPCLAARIGATAPPSGYTTVPPYSTTTAPAASEPSPVLAGLLGLIPGVGAMYNGQFAKGIVHLAVFAVLVSLSDNVNGIFGLFCAGWVFYMAFEAYHTAIARRDGLPLPNAFNLNDIGERMGFGKSWPATGTARAGGTPATPQPANAAAPAGTANPYTAPSTAPINPVPVGTAPDWVGYVPPTAFASASYRSGTAAQYEQGAPSTSYVPPTYGETYTGVPPAAYSAPVDATIPVVVPTRRFPTGAIWLIGLGALILAANLLPDWKITERWWPPVLFAGLSVWAFTRRLHPGARIVCILRWPAILMILAVMLALHAAGVLVTFGLICSVLLIAFGALLLLERVAGSNPAYAPTTFAAAAAGPTTPPYPAAEAAHSRAAWEATNQEIPGNDPGAKEGQ